MEIAGINQSFIMAMAVIFMALGILYQVVIGVLYQRMIQSTDTLSGGDNKLLGQCKERFIQCYKLNGGVSNISVFVDKFMNRLRFAGMSISLMKHLSGQLMLAGVFVAGFGVCKGIIEGNRFVDLLPFYILSLFGIYLYLSVCSIVDIAGRKQMLKTNLTDYLENHVAERLEHGMAQKEKLLRELEQVRSSRRQSDMEDRQEDEQKEQPHTKPEPIFSPDEALELEELLKSLMV